MLDDFIKENFKRRYVINLLRRSDRYNEFKTRTCIYFNPELFEKFDAVDGKQIDKNTLEPFFKNSNTRNGEIGCHLSHRKIWENVSEDETLEDDDLIIVFEDDVFFTDHNFESKFTDSINCFKQIKVPNKMLYIGGRFDKNFQPMKNELNLHWKNAFFQSNNFQERIYKPIIAKHIFDRTTHALIFTKYAAKIFLQSSLCYEKKPVALDSFLIWCHHQKKGPIHYYDFFPHLCYSPINYKTDIQ